MYFYTMVATSLSWCWSSQVILIKGLILIEQYLKQLWTFHLLILVVTYFLSCNFEKLMFYILCHVQCPYEKIFKLLWVFCWSSSSQKLLHLWRLHCVKSVQIRSYFWSEYRKIRTSNNSVFGNFSRSVDTSKQISKKMLF